MFCDRCKINLSYLSDGIWMCKRCKRYVDEDEEQQEDTQPVKE